MHLRTILLCAWVLWTHFPGGVVGGEFPFLRQPHHEPLGAYETRAACEQARIQTRVPPGYDRLFCLPDTVNPNK